jgi:hypothetical protein
MVLHRVFVVLCWKKLFLRTVPQLISWVRLFILVESPGQGPNPEPRSAISSVDQCRRRRTEKENRISSTLGTRQRGARHGSPPLVHPTIDDQHFSRCPTGVSCRRDTPSRSCSTAEQGQENVKVELVARVDIINCPAGVLSGHFTPRSSVYGRYALLSYMTEFFSLRLLENSDTKTTSETHDMRDHR